MISTPGGGARQRLRRHGDPGHPGPAHHRRRFGLEGADVARIAPREASLVDGQRIVRRCREWIRALAAGTPRLAPGSQRLRRRPGAVHRQRTECRIDSNEVVVAGVEPALIRGRVLEVVALVASDGAGAVVGRPGGLAALEDRVARNPLDARVHTATLRGRTPSRSGGGIAVERIAGEGYHSRALIEHATTEATERGTTGPRLAGDRRVAGDRVVDER